jgi:hypothetical protein
VVGVSDPVERDGACPGITSDIPLSHQWQPVGLVPEPGALHTDASMLGALPVFEICMSCRTSRVELFPPTEDAGTGITFRV